MALQSCRAMCAWLMTSIKLALLLGLKNKYIQYLTKHQTVEVAPTPTELANSPSFQFLDAAFNSKAVWYPYNMAPAAWAVVELGIVWRDVGELYRLIGTADVRFRAALHVLAIRQLGLFQPLILQLHTQA